MFPFVSSFWLKRWVFTCCLINTSLRFRLILRGSELTGESFHLPCATHWLKETYRLNSSLCHQRFGPSPACACKALIWSRNWPSTLSWPAGSQLPSYFWVMKSDFEPFRSYYHTMIQSSNIRTMIFWLSTSSTYCYTNVVALPGIWHHEQGFSASSPFPRSTFSSSLPLCTKAARLSEPCSSLCPAWCGDNLCNQKNKMRWVFSELTKRFAQWNQITTSSSTLVNPRSLWRQNKTKHNNIRVHHSCSSTAWKARHKTNKALHEFLARPTAWAN